MIDAGPNHRSSIVETDERPTGGHHKKSEREQLVLARQIFRRRPIND